MTRQQRIRTARPRHYAGKVDLTKRRLWFADLVPVVASVQLVTGGGGQVTGGATGIRAQIVYKDTSDGEWKLADANAAATLSTVRDNIGLLMTDMYNANQCLIAKHGDRVDLGVTLVAGTRYGITSTDAVTANGAAGGIVALSALGTGDTPVLLFIGEGTNIATLNIVIGTVIP